MANIERENWNRSHIEDEVKVFLSEKCLEGVFCFCFGDYITMENRSIYRGSFLAELSLVW